MCMVIHVCCATLKCYFLFCSDVDRESFDGYSIGSIGAESAPRGINTEKSSIPLIPLTMGKISIVAGVK